MDTDAFAGRLLPAERVTWTGQPAQGLLLTARDIFFIPFSLAWCGFAIFWEASVVGVSTRIASNAGPVANVPVAMVAFGAVFVCLGLFFVFGRFLADAWIRRNIAYAVTNERVLIARSGPFGTFSSLNLDRLPDVQISERANGRGTIRFGERPSMWGNRSFGAWLPALDPTPQFLAIADARRVFDLIQGQARGNA